MTDCPLCAAHDESIIWQDDLCRVIRVADDDYPAFLRVIWHSHVSEMSDLTPSGRRHLMNVVLAAETALRALLSPDKINLASFGNQVPHMHWHVIPRHWNDRHFPESVWGAPQRAGTPLLPPPDDDIARALTSALAELTSG